jgi:hypothetical protein
LGGRDQEDPGLKKTWANSSRDPISKKTLHKKLGLMVWLKVKALSSNPSTTPKKKKKNELERDIGNFLVMEIICVLIGHWIQSPKWNSHTVEPCINICLLTPIKMCI